MGAARLVWLAALALLMAVPARAQSDGLPTEPMLRINAPGHIAAIKCIATDAAERFAVTASHDKTVRVWSLPDGTLQRVIWLPSGEGHLGKAYRRGAVAGRRHHRGGRLDLADRVTKNIYLFDRASGALLRRLPGLPNVVHHLAFSPDGRRLAAALAGRTASGCSTPPTATGRCPATATMAMAATGWTSTAPAVWYRRASTGSCGYMRRTATTGRPCRGRGCGGSGGRSPSPSRPTAGISPSGTMTVRRWRCCVTATCSRRASPRSPAWMPARLNVAWSQDGGQLFAEGYHLRHPDRLARRWDKAGAGSFIDIVGARNTVMQFVPLRGRRMLFADASGFGLIDPAGKATRLQDQGSIDTSGATTSLRISADARTVQVTDGMSGRVLRFALARRTVAVDPAEDKALAVAITGSDRIKFTDWEDNFSPKLNGEKLVLDQDEISRSVALVPGTDRFVLGADWSLRLFDAGGKAVWSEPRPVPAVVWGVNVSADGRLIVAAYGDGTIRWHRVSDGAELLALFMHPDGKRWVAWTPQGYYDASAGADDLIGWQVNHGYDQAPDFFPAAQFQQRFNRRDVIARVLDTLDVDQAVEAGEQRGRPEGRQGGTADRVGTDTGGRDQGSRPGQRADQPRLHADLCRPADQRRADPTCGGADRRRPGRSSGRADPRRAGHEGRLAPLHAAAAGREDLGHRLQQPTVRARPPRSRCTGKGRAGTTRRPCTCWRSASRTTRPRACRRSVSPRRTRMISSHWRSSSTAACCTVGW